ncbi:hypothetical protein GCM10010255_63540 [Streptomyces coeruleofuscus]|uniref:Uncharacterized protein n=1 Tax=Streptomyces coeruleofuscus TaxID=66879 RepID=A0ABP5VZY1_9ACTN
MVLVADGRAKPPGPVAENVLKALVSEKPLPKQDKSRTVDSDDALYGLEVENRTEARSPTSQASPAPAIPGHRPPYTACRPPGRATLGPCAW